MKLIHKKADVHKKSTIGENTKVWQFCVVLAGAIIGNDCNINAGCFIENDVILGDRVTLKCGVYLWDGVRIADDVFIGPSVAFVNDKRVRSKMHKVPLSVNILKGASVGANSTIMSGVTIGQYAFIGAGAVITKNIKPHELWYGNPARLKGYVCVCGEKLDSKLICTCGKKYKKSKGVVSEITKK